MLNYYEIIKETEKEMHKLDACVKAVDLLGSAGYYQKEVWYSLMDEISDLKISIEMVFEVIHSDMVLRHLLNDETEKFHWTIETNVSSWTLQNEYSIELIGAIAEVFNGESEFSADYDYISSSKWISIETR